MSKESSCGAYYLTCPMDKRIKCDHAEDCYNMLSIAIAKPDFRVMAPVSYIEIIEQRAIRKDKRR